MDLDLYVKNVEKRALDVAKTIMNQAFVRETGHNYMSIYEMAKVYFGHNKWSGEFIASYALRAFYRL